MNINKKLISLLLSITIISMMGVFNVFSQEIEVEHKAIEGQYFDKSDPRGIGVFTENEIKNGLEKAQLSKQIVSIMNDTNKNKRELEKSEVECIEEYIKRYNQDLEISTFVNWNTSNSLTRAIGDYQAMNLNLPGEKQKEPNFCAPASIQAVLRGKGIDVDQYVLASYCGIVANGGGTNLSNVAPVLNRYNRASGGSNLNFYYDTLLADAVPSSSWNVTMTDSAIATIVGGYGVIYDVHQVKGSPHYLQGYESMQADNIYHYVAGEGFDATDPSRRICYYFDSNDQKSNLGNRHMQITFATMGVLTNDMGLVF